MVKKISLHQNYSFKEIEKLRKNQEVILINNVYDGRENVYGQFIKVKVLEYYDSKEFSKQLKELPEIIKTKKYSDILFKLTYEDQENYIDTLKSLCEKIKDKTLLKLFGLSHTKENYKELSKDLLEMRVKN